MLESYFLRGMLALAISSLACGCAEQARIYPMDEAAVRAGTPTIEFVRQAIGRGPVKVTMPDGEILKGEYQITENAAVASAFSGFYSATAVGYGSNRQVVITATGERGTVINCEGTADIGGHGSGTCSTSRGNKYRVMF